ALESLRSSLLERAMDVRFTQAKLRRDGEQYPLRAAGTLGVLGVCEQRSVGSQGLASGDARRALEGGVAAGILSGVVVGEAVEVSVVGGLIVEQVRDAEIDAGAAREQL